MNNKILNKEQEFEVINILINTTLSLIKISEKYNCSTDVIQRIKKENNINRKNDNLSETKIQEILELLKTSKMTQKEIGIITNTSESSVFLIKRKFNINRYNVPNNKRPPKQCPSCGKNVSDLLCAHNRNHQFCNRKCYANWRKINMVGDKNPAWKGGKPKSIIASLRDLPEWEEWRKKVFYRDNHTCQKCKERGNSLHAHHYVPKSVDVSKVFEVDNGITLCKNCHKEVHSKKDMNYMKCLPKVTNQYTTEYK